MVLSDLQPLIEGFAPTTYVAGGLTVGYFTLVAVVSCVATFARGDLSRRAYRVLKVLTRWKYGPPGPGAPGG